MTTAEILAELEARNIKVAGVGGAHANRPHEHTGRVRDTITGIVTLNQYPDGESASMT